VGALGGAPAAQLHDEREHLRDLREQVRGDLLTELAGGVQRPRERDVLDQRDPPGVRLLADARGDVAGSLGDDARRPGARLVLERDGDVRGARLAPRVGRSAEFAPPLRLRTVQRAISGGPCELGERRC